MRLVRVTAEYREGGVSHRDYRIVFICGISPDNRMVEAEWFGYVRNESIIYPFVLRRGKEIFYGGEEHSAEPTNIGVREIKAGECFTLSSPAHDIEKIDSVYTITNVHQLDG